MLKKAVVTGARGLIGRALVERLVADGTIVIAVDQKPPETSCEHLTADVTQPDILRSLLDPETTVFHLAALTSVSQSVREPQRDFSVNVGGFLNILESVREANARLVFPSSASVFDPRAPLPHVETAPKSPNSPYAAAKLACEGYCVAYYKCYDLDVKTARLFNIYGPGMNRFAIYDFYRKIREADNEIKILGDGSQTRDYLYLADAVTGLILIAERGRPGEDYNLATGVPTTSRQLAELMLEVMECREVAIRTTEDTFPGDVAAWFADISKIRTLGFEPLVVLKEGLRQTVEWFEDQHAHRVGTA